MLGAGSILAGAFIGAGIGALSTTAMKAGEEISTGNVRSAGERLAYAVFDDSMSWDEKWAYAFDPEQMVADFVTGVVIGEFLDGMMAATQNKLRSIFANYDAAMREAIESGINSIDDIALKHSSVGDFTYNPKTGQISRMKGGGHGQSNINF